MATFKGTNSVKLPGKSSLGAHLVTDWSAILTQEPEGVGPEKYDETAAAMIAQLKYGSGAPFYRLEQLQGGWGFRYRRRGNGKWSKKQPS
jgi:hypothetical protein